MAYADDQTTEEENQNKNAGEPELNAPITAASSVGGGATSAKSGNQASSAVAPAPFTNLQSYLSVNAPKIQSTADTVAGQLGNNYNQTKGAIDTAGQNFSNQVNAGYAAPDKNIVNQAAADPTGFAKNADNVAAFQKQFKNQYGGPDAFETTGDYGTVQGAAQKAVNQAQNLGTYSGLQSYLTSNVESNPTQAMSALDTALLNQSPGAIQTIQNAAKPLGTLNDYLGSTVKNQNANVTNAQQAAQQAAKYAQDTFTGQTGILPTFQNDVNSRLAQTRTAAQSAADTARANLLAGNPTTKDLSLIGTDRPGIQSILEAVPALKSDYGQNASLAGYLTQQAPDVVFNSANTVATPEDYAKAEALGRLTGQDLSSFLNPQLAGQNPTSLLNFNKAGAQHDIADQLQTLDKDLLLKQLQGWEPSHQGYGPDHTASLADYTQPYSGSNQSLAQLMQGLLSGEDLRKFNDAAKRLGYLDTPVAPPTPLTPGTPNVFHAS